LRQLNALEVVSDIAPGILAGVLDGALKQQGKHRDGNVCVNAVGCPMKDRTHLQTTLHRPPSLFHPLLLFVTQRHILSAVRVIVAMHHELAVKAFKFLDRLGVDRQTLFGLLEQTPVALTAR